VVEIIFALATCLFIRCLKSFRPVNTLRLIDEKIAPLAVFSYTLYLIHYSIGYLYRFYFPNKHQVVDLGHFLGYLGLLVVSTLVCFAVYQLGERHTAFFKRKWDQLLPQR
jgi:peptidoglycan/LPS O-acetylase OafA/YrhL